MKKKSRGTIIHWYGTLKTTNAGESWDWVWKGGGRAGQQYFTLPTSLMIMRRPEKNKGL